MSKYPSEITDAVLEGLSTISDDQVRRDIRDTEGEIAMYEARMSAEMVTAERHPNNNERRLAALYAGARPEMISDRQDFVAFLTAVLEARRARSASAVEPGGTAPDPATTDSAKPAGAIKPGR